MDISKQAALLNLATIQLQRHPSTWSANTNTQFHFTKCLSDRFSQVDTLQKGPETLTDRNQFLDVVDQEATIYYRCPFCSRFTSIWFWTNYPLVTCQFCGRNSCSYCKVPSHEGISCYEFSGHGPTNIVDPDSYTSLLLTRGECLVCLETKAIWKRPCCDMRLCLACLNTYISDKVDEGIIDINCPGHPCLTPLDPILIKQIIDEAKSKRLSFLRVKAGRYKFKRACPFCDFILSMDEPVLEFYTNFESIVVCPECTKEWCIHCMAPWHTGMSCEEYRSSKTNTGVEKWASKKQSNGDRNGQKCPSCQVWIQRTAGCDMMTCSQCETKFCYKCGIKTPHPDGAQCPPVEPEITPDEDEITPVEDEITPDSQEPTAPPLPEEWLEPTPDETVDRFPPPLCRILEQAPIDRPYVSLVHVESNRRVKAKGCSARPQPSAPSLSEASLDNTFQINYRGNIWTYETFIHPPENAELQLSLLGEGYHFVATQL